MKPRKGFSKVHPTDLEVGDTIYVADDAGDFVLQSKSFRIDYLEDDGYLAYVGPDLKGGYKKYIDLGGLYVFRKDK